MVMNGTVVAKRRETLRRFCIQFLNTPPDDDGYLLLLTNLHNATRRLLHATYDDGE